MANRSFSDAERRKILSEYLSRTETVASLLQRYSLSQSTFYSWLSKERKGNSNNRVEQRPAVVNMLPVLRSAPERTGSVGLTLCKGMSLQFSSDASADYVAHIVKALL